MNSPKDSGADHARDGGHDNDEQRGPNLKLMYSLILLAMLAAIGAAALIVLPFYQRR